MFLFIYLFLFYLFYLLFAVDGMNDTRKAVVKGPYLFCRTLNWLVINFEFRFLNLIPAVEPIILVLRWRFWEGQWNTFDKLVSV